MRLLVPLYEHPALRPEFWRQLLRAAPRLYGVVVNPASGAGEAPDPAFADACGRLRAAGVRQLAYVDTGYGLRARAQVAAEVERYQRWYGTDGVFLDQTASDPAELRYYRRLVRQLRGQLGVHHVVFNHGTYPDRRYAELADLLVTYEGDWRTYRTPNPVPDWVRELSPERHCHLVYGVPRGHGHRVAPLSAARGAGVYCQVPGALPHPWDGLPEELEPAA